jgi:hypothetical protein
VRETEVLERERESDVLAGRSVFGEIERERERDRERERERQKQRERERERE